MRALATAALVALLAPGLAAAQKVTGDASSATVTATGSTTPRALRDWAREIDGATSAQVQPFLSKIKRGVDDAAILVLGDSTGNDSNEWVYLLAQQLGTRFRSHTVKYTLWNGTAFDPATTATVSTGTGARKVSIYNGSVAGARSFYALGGLWAAMVAGLTPDLIFVSYGHNQGTAVPSMWRPDFLSLTESLTEEHPGAGIVVILQNPATSDSYQAQRNAVYEQVAQERGYGTVNVWQAFVDYGTTWSTALMTDAVHPNAAGSSLWASEVMRTLVFSRRASPRARPPSSVMVAGRQLIQNGDFTLWGGAGSAVPDGWTSGGSPTIARDAAHTESPMGYALQVTAAGGAPGWLQQNLPLSAVQGKWVTVLARVYVPNGAPAGAGVVALYDGTLYSNVSNGSGGYTGGAFRWVVASYKFPSNAATARVYLYADSGANNGTATFDSVSVVVGDLPLAWPGARTGGVRPGRLNSAGLISSATLYSGTGVPSNSYGLDGDFYFRTDTPGTANQRLYVKSAGAWVGVL